MYIRVGGNNSFWLTTYSIRTRTFKKLLLDGNDNLPQFTY